MKMRTLLGVLLTSAALQVSACDAGQPWLQFEIISPLMPAAPALRLSVDEGGCAVVEYPLWHVRPGRHSLQLQPAELSALKHEIEQSEVYGLDLYALRAATVDSGQLSNGIVYRITDDNEMRLQIAADENRESLRLRWNGLDQDLLNAPDNAGLITLAALRDRLWELGRSSAMRAQQ